MTYPNIVPIGTAHQAMSTPPEPPEHMTDEGRDIWVELAPLYRLSVKDLVEFEAFCEAVAEFREASGYVKESGIAIIDPETGMPIANPVLSIRNQSDRKIAYWAGRFRGM